MKQYFTFFIAFALIFCIRQTVFSQSFELTTPKDTITMIAGDTAKIDINVTIYNGFDASIFLTLSKPYKDIPASKPYLTSETLNYPYKGLQLVVPTKPYLTQPGVFSFAVNGTNGQLHYPVGVTVIIKATIPPQNWRIFPLWLTEEKYLGGGNTYFIMQDSLYNYWNSHNGTHKEDKGTPPEKWGKSKTNFGNITTTPVWDYKNNKVWLPTSKGLVRCDTLGQFKTIFDTTNSPLRGYSINALVRDRITNDLWVGDFNGLYRYSGSTWTAFDSTNSVLKNEQITSILISDSIVWVGTFDGLAKFDGKNWTRFTMQNSSIPDSIVHVMAAESNGDIWMALRTIVGNNYDQKIKLEVAKFDGTTWTVFNEQNSPIGSGIYVNSIAIDKKGNKWISTASYYLGSHATYYYGKGILKYDNKDWTVYSSANTPLPSNRINQLSVDSFDNVWFHAIPIGGSSVDGFWGVFNENGKPLSFSVTGIDEQPSPALEGFSIYPNPTSSSLFVTGIDGGTTLRIINSLGVEMVSLQTLSDKLEVDVSSLPSGLYFVKIRTNSGIAVKPIIICR